MSNSDRLIIDENCVNMPIFDFHSFAFDFGVVISDFNVDCGEVSKESEIKLRGISKEKDAYNPQFDVDLKQKEKRKHKHESLAKTMALYADQYKTTMVGGMTTVGGPTAIHDREDDEFNEKIMQEITCLLRDENLIETKFEFDGKCERRFRKDQLRLKAELEQYCQLEELIGEDMMNVLCKTENLDGTSDFNVKDAPICKRKQLKRADDPAYELQWM